MIVYTITHKRINEMRNINHIELYTFNGTILFAVYC